MGNIFSLNLACHTSAQKFGNFIVLNDIQDSIYFLKAYHLKCEIT